MEKEILEKYPPKDRSNLIALLQEVHEVYGYLPEDDLRAIAEYLNLPLSSVYDVATFNNQFILTPLGKNVIRICRGVVCHVKDSANLLIALESELGIKTGQTTRDKNFTLETVACIGACSIAPVININGDYYGRAVIKEIPKILAKYKKEEISKNKIKKYNGIEN
jgi:NADH-quinone oxidoreductase E subunit